MSEMMGKLRKRIEENYEALRIGMTAYLRIEIFDSATFIAAATEVYNYICDNDCLSDAEAIYLLDFSDPLTMLADAWVEHLSVYESQFRPIIESVLTNEKNDELYVIRALEDEYGAGYDSV